MVPFSPVSKLPELIDNLGPSINRWSSIPFIYNSGTGRAIAFAFFIFLASHNLPRSIRLFMVRPHVDLSVNY